MKRRQKRTYRRRRTALRRRRAARNAPILRRILYAKCKSVQIIPLLGNAITDNTYQVSFARCQQNGLLANVYGFDGGDRYQAMAPNWEQMAITGMSIQYIPSNRVTMFNDTAGTVIGGIKQLSVFDDIDTYNTTSYSD